MNTEKYFITEESVKWEEVGVGVFRQIMGYDEQLMQVKVRFEPGRVAPEHAHIHSQTTYVVSGVFEFTVGGEKRIVKPGDGIYMPPNVKHGVVCIEEGILLDSFSPCRKDFLK